MGFGLALPITYTWSKRGRKNRLKVPTRWGSSGRLNLIGALSWPHRQLHFGVVDGSVDSQKVVAFIQALTQNADPEKLTVVVLDNATFHTSALVKTHRALWEHKNVFLRHLPPYCPHLNPIEAFWKRLKAFLLPRRCYDSLSQLKLAVLDVLDLLGAIRVVSSMGGA